MPRVKEDRHPGGRPALTPLSPFGERLKAKLDAKGWSRNTLAREAGMNPSTLWRWMVGKASPPLDDVLLICQTVGCASTDLIPKKAR